MEIKILGTGCPKCQALERNTREALKEMGIEAEVTEVKDIKKIMQYDIMTTPGIVINEKVKAAGKVLSKDEIKKLIEEENV
ncbi:thioredoxin family protein [Calorimonas adulescens]|uniref:Thioredoxin family protein n=1 Tax=Calorimonas adulescens TaxID=2606906 RepID=A0A5D8QCM2_9THEO|nr:thioredoxin family protein [Calorimonas adulescens]TZE82282.1 thioredoxin family protein [Calorimonas adulescens]